MTWLPFSIIGAFIGGFLGRAVCSNCGPGSGDAIGAVAGLLYMAVGAIIGMIVGGIGGIIFAAITETRESPVESQLDPESADARVDRGA